MNFARALLARLNDFWYGLRHTVYFYNVKTPEPITASGGDDTANIQNAINKAGKEPEFFRDIREEYESKWYRFLLKKPVLRATVYLKAGTYYLHEPLIISGSMTLSGKAAPHKETDGEK